MSIAVRMEISTDAAISALLNAKQGAVQSEIAFSVAAKALDAQQAAGDAAVGLIESAARLGKAAGRGERFDAVR
ncbi:hypothetical protein [Pirellulimonas nuda]|uniref:hypothetical protein n=1 Tax=Pirellulimonas nuda TaxID=2528009 RepID=UPI0011A68881|nr:hypothetical protein [Pirellulimonas nuda]